MISEHNVSDKAERSNATRVSGMAVVSAPVPIVETSRSVQTFEKIYDRLFAEFAEKLRDEY